MPKEKRKGGNNQEMLNNTKKKRDNRVVSIKELEKDNQNLGDVSESMEVGFIVPNTLILDKKMTTSKEGIIFDNSTKSSVQEWLDKNYPLEKKEEITEINAKDWELEREDLKGKLKFGGFRNLKKIILNKKVVKNIEEIEFVDLPNLEEVKFDLGFKEANEGEESIIKLSNLPKLEQFLANHGKCEKIEIENCPQITDLRLGNNLLTDLSFLENLNSERLKILSIHSNNFKEQDLSLLNQFTNLEKLFIDNADEEKIKRNIYNRFTDSLNSLKNLDKLKELSISNTDIDFQSNLLNHLPKSLEIITCSSDKRSSSKVKELAEKLKKLGKKWNWHFDEKSGKFNLNKMKEWKDVHSEFDGVSGKEKIKQWESKGFSLQQTREWIEGGFSPDEAEIVSYLKGINYYGNVEFWKSPFNKTEKDKAKSKLKEAYRGSGDWKKKYAQEWLNKEYPKDGKCRGEFDKENEDKLRKDIKELDIGGEELEGELNLENFKGLQYLICRNNKLTKIILSDCSNLVVIDCENNKLNETKLAKGLNLKEFRGSNNKFTSINNILDNIEKNSLTYFDISNNLICQDITKFGDFLRLESLYMDNSEFFGSLKDLKKLENLIEIGIRGTEINIDYPNELKKEKKFFNSLEKIYCDENSENSSIKDFSKCYNKDNNFYDIRLWMDNKKMSESMEVEATIKIPLLLNDKTWHEVSRIKENYNPEGINYFEKGKLIYPSEVETGFAWKLGEQIPLSKLPLRLCHITSDNEIEIKKRVECADDAKYYAILSYSWGGKHKEEIKWSPERARERLSQGGAKSLEKAIKSLKVLNKFHLLTEENADEERKVKYLWMDQLCVNQNNDKEKSHEIPKMREYYGNSTVTLVAIHAEVGEGNIRKLLKSFERGESGLIYPNEIIKNSLPILEKIIGSEWFSRSWTFQEGFLSKQIIFMFDDFLIDGRFMALIWKLRQFSSAHYDECTDMKKICSEKVATPVGWAYHKHDNIEGYSLRDKISLRLHEALWAVKDRGRALPLDGIYSIIGLLPYGDKIKVDYEKDPEFVLREVMLVAIKNKYFEPLSWHGFGSKTPGLCWVPRIDHSGSSSVTGGIKITYKHGETKLDYVSDIGIKIQGREYLIEERSIGTYKLERDESIEGGLWMRKAWVVESEKNNNKNNKEKLTLAGTWEGIHAVSEERVLILPDEEVWKGEVHFAILALVVGEFDENIRHRIDLVRIKEGYDNLTKTEGGKKEIILGITSLKDIGQQTQIEIPPK